MESEKLKDIKKLSVLIPVYNSESTIGPLVDTVVESLADKYGSLEVVLVNDGSRDGSHDEVLKLVSRHSDTVRYIRLARNFGEHNAVMCGLNYVTGDCVAIIDDDFQNAPSEISSLVEKFRMGYDVVYSYYEDKKHSFLRNLGSSFNGWVATMVLKKPRNLYLSSFKVIGLPLVRNIIQYSGPFPYLDGIILRSTNRIGTQVSKHEERAEGRSNYTLGKLIILWLNMFTGYSIAPLRIASFMGLFISFMSIFFIILIGITKILGTGIFFKHEIPVGWTSLIIAVTFFSGVNLCVLGIIGEYMGRLSLTLNRTPQFIVSETYGNMDGPAAGTGGKQDGAR